MISECQDGFICCYESGINPCLLNSLSIQIRHRPVKMQHLIGSLGWVRPETAFQNILRQWFNSEVLKGIKLPTTQTDFNKKKIDHTHTQSNITGVEFRPRWLTYYQKTVHFSSLASFGWLQFEADSDKVICHRLQGYILATY